MRFCIKMLIYSNFIYMTLYENKICCNMQKGTFGTYHVYPKRLDRQASANCFDPDQNAASDQGLHSLPIIQQYFRWINPCHAE